MNVLPGSPPFSVCTVLMRGRTGKDIVTGLVMLGAGEETMHTRGEEDSLPPHDLPRGITLDHTINVYLWECGICGSINKFIRYKYEDVKKLLCIHNPHISTCIVL